MIVIDKSVGSPAMQPILDACREWAEKHSDKVSGWLYRATSTGQYFFPVYKKWPVDFDLEDDLCSLDLELSRKHEGTHILMMLAPPRDMVDVLDFARFAIGEESSY